MGRRGRRRKGACGVGGGVDAIVGAIRAWFIGSDSGVKAFSLTFLQMLDYTDAGQDQLADIQSRMEELGNAFATGGATTAFNNYSAAADDLRERLESVIAGVKDAAAGDELAELIGQADALRSAMDAIANGRESLGAEAAGQATLKWREYRDELRATEKKMEDLRGKAIVDEETQRRLTHRIASGRAECRVEQDSEIILRGNLNDVNGLERINAMRDAASQASEEFSRLKASTQQLDSTGKEALRASLEV